MVTQEQGAEFVAATSVAPGLRHRVAQHLRARWPSIRRSLPRDLVIVAALSLLLQPFSISWVMTESIGAHMALVIKGAMPKPGELVAFAYTGGEIPGYYLSTPTTRLGLALGLHPRLDGPRRGDGFIKYLMGIEGDRIEVQGRQVFLNTPRGRFAVGEAKPVSRHGVPLQVIAPQVIPPGYVYVWAPHVDALDSRYQLLGLVPASAIVGKGVALW